MATSDDQPIVIVNVTQDDNGPKTGNLATISTVPPAINPTLSITPTIFPIRRYEFQPPKTSMASSSSLLGADLSSSTLMMAPPKLNTVKKSRLLVNPGKSMVEWMKIQQELTAKGPSAKLRKIGFDELATHNTLGDVWMAINDRVFDVSDYTNYHPGGVEELMKGAGQDATNLFNQIHRWVNFESILRGNLLGFLVKEPTLRVVRKIQPGSLSTALSCLPSTKFSEDDNFIDSHMDGNDVRQESWTVGLLNRERLILKVMVKPPKVWMTHLRLLKALTDDNININYENNFKRALITLKKPQQQERWLKLGVPLSDHHQLVDSRASIEDMYPAKLVKRQKLTRNSYMFTAVTHTAAIGVPIGFHVQIRLTQNVTRPFTPVSLTITQPNVEVEESALQTNTQELHFIIKIYPDGQFTSLLENLLSKTKEQEIEKESEIDVEIGFPRGNFDTFFLHNISNTLCLLAGGSGITPFVRIIQYLYHRRASIPIKHVVLLFFNETFEDVIWAKEWQDLAKENESPSSWFHFYPVISKPVELSSEEWTGRVSIKLFEQCIQDCIPSASTKDGESKAIICGSYGFNAACKEVLKQQTVLDIDDPSGIFIFNG
ncbi:Cytochrome b5 reductase 4 [Folsomia candida]|uniref:Cytochrome b5 reductase 4 n=1 Tax=Folsomia candida TaxID=158441 RepID=A0A226E2F6_FOLCA|nr:Cytochrome b5 reductase 4 [Folsomia candida]